MMQPDGDRISELERQVAELTGKMNRLLDDPMARSMVEGTRRVPFGTAYRSPNDAGLRYALVRVAGGAAEFVATPAALTDWSDA